MVKCNRPLHASLEGREESRQIACDLAGESKALEGIEGAALMAGERQAEAAKLKVQSLDLLELAGSRLARRIPLDMDYP